MYNYFTPSNYYYCTRHYLHVCTKNYKLYIHIVILLRVQEVITFHYFNDNSFSYTTGVFIAGTEWEKCKLMTENVLQSNLQRNRKLRKRGCTE